MSNGLARSRTKERAPRVPFLSSVNMTTVQLVGHHRATWPQLLHLIGRRILGGGRFYQTDCSQFRLHVWQAQHRQYSAVEGIASGVQQHHGSELLRRRILELKLSTSLLYSHKPWRGWGIRKFGSGSGLNNPDLPVPANLKFGSHNRDVTRALASPKILGRLPQISFKPTPRAETAPTAVNVLKSRQNSSGPCLLFHKIPPLLVEGRGQYLFDDKGVRYLDMFGFDSTVTVGHNHPLVAESIRKQAVKLTHCSHHYISEEVAQFTEALLQKIPPYLPSVFLVNSESEAVELAVLLARQSSQNYEMVCLQGSYCGFTAQAGALSGLSAYKQPLGHVGHGVVHVPVPDIYRSPAKDSEAVEEFLQSAVSSIRASTSGRLAACLLEAVQSMNGVNFIPPSYLESLASAVARRQGLIIFDETNSLMGRLGHSFWAFEKVGGVLPDIVVAGKGLANGLPFSAVIARQEIANCIRSKLYTNAHAGNPMCCAAALGTLKAYVNDGCMENAAYVGSYLLQLLKNLQNCHKEQIGHVRGKGLLAAVEFVQNPVNRQPAARCEGFKTMN